VLGACNLFLILDFELVSNFDIRISDLFGFWCLELGISGAGFALHPALAVLGGELAVPCSPKSA